MPSRSVHVRLGLIIAFALGAGCGSSQAPAGLAVPAATPVSATVARSGPPPNAAPSATSSSALQRQGVHEAVQRGLGAFLQRLDLDDHPVIVGGRFKGFRIAALRGGAFWSGVDLRPGDVVMRVNGFPIERPEQAQTAFESLDVASELRVDYERDGLPRMLVYSITDAR